MHFEIHYQAGREDLALRTASIAENEYHRLANILRHEPAYTIPLIIDPALNAIKGCRFVSGRHSAPHSCEKAYPYNSIAVPFSGSYPEYRRRLNHALAHSFQQSIIAQNKKIVPTLSTLRMPLWLAEGMAEYLAAGFDHRAGALVHELLAQGRVTGILDISANLSIDAARARLLGQAFFYFIEKRYGLDAFGEMIRDFRDLGFIDQVMKVATGKHLKELDDEWKAFLLEKLRDCCGAEEPVDASTRILSEDRSRDYLIPAVSPDGSRIAYVFTREGIPILKITSLITDGHRFITRTFSPRDTAACNDIGRIISCATKVSWSRDGKRFLIAGGMRGRQMLVFADTSTGRIVSSRPLPFMAIRNASLSHDAGFAVFTGFAGGAEDIYTYTFADGSLRRLTDDAFSDTSPSVMPDGTGVIFSSNWNGSGNIYSDKYSLFRVDLKSGARIPVAGIGGNSIQPDISPDGRKLLYVSDADGFPAVWLYDFATREKRRLTNNRTGAFHPCWHPDGKRFVCSINRDNTYELREYTIEQSGTGNTAARGCTCDSGLRESYENTYRYIFSTYRTRIMPNHGKIRADVSDAGSTVALKLEMADVLSLHRFVYTGQYMRECTENDLSADLSYYYSIQGWHLGVSLFRQASPVSAASLAAGNLLAGGITPGVRAYGSAYYGGAASVTFHCGPFWKSALRIEAGGYQNRFRQMELRDNYTAGMGKISLSAEYDSCVRGAMLPVRGTTGRLLLEQGLGFNRSRTWTAITGDLRYHANPARQVILTFSGSGGTILGFPPDEISYHIGGSTSLRGFNLLGISGRNMFFFNVELWLTPGAWRTFGMPQSGAAGSIGFVLFADAGAAWTGAFSFIDKRGRFDDFKIDFGLGIRAAIFPVLFLKLDFAWPFDKKSLKDNKIIFSIGIDY
ncbi:MAG: PD40 domain-containing protein [Spirochaetes bacterium]|nr:PD40 domain-containing protein [Spirochaetota bacterium]